LDKLHKVLNLIYCILDFVFNLIYCILDFFFKSTDKLRDKLLKITSKEIGIFRVFCLVIFIILSFVFVKFRLKIITQLVLIFAALSIFIDYFLYKMPEMLSSVRNFFKIGILLNLFLIFFGFLILYSIYGENISILLNGLLILISLIWIFMSCCVEMKVSILSNAILTGINAILLKLVDYFYKYNLNNQELKKNLDTIFLFTTIILGLTTMTCSMKKYWEENKKN
jgi:hypothetical protein